VEGELYNHSCICPVLEVVVITSAMKIMFSVFLTLFLFNMKLVLNVLIVSSVWNQTVGLHIF
jgi:hypothetical protein